MKRIIIFLLVFSAIINQNIAQPVSSNYLTEEYQLTSEFYNKLISGDHPKTSLLTLFLTEMPKGGDLHHHYTGTIYAETYLDWVKEKGWKIDACSLRIVTDGSSNGSCGLLTVDELIKNDILYRKLLTLWSDKDYKNHFHNQPPPDQNFFNTFGYFGTVSNEYMDTGLQILKSRAINENVQYIETMLSSVAVSSKNYPDRDRMIESLRSIKTQQELDGLLEEIDLYYSSDVQFKKNVDDFVANAETVHKGLDDDDFTMRFQTYCVRVFDPLEVYTDLLAGFIASDASELIVGVNIVAPENNTVALQDYTLHMRMFNYLSRRYPKVNRALHAGELTLGMVRPKDLIFHIDEAINIAYAQRIGHGIDIAYEGNSIQLLQQMKDKAAVEINLTSNEFILGVEYNEHPYLIYSRYKVPMVISTDDSGVSRNNLTNEYLLLATRYRPGYIQIKEYVYNSIKYSFLPSNLKRRLTTRLDNRFSEFEKKISMLSKKMN